MELASAIVGLLAVGTQVYSALNTFISTCQDAPIIAQTTRDEVRDFHYALTRLRDHVWQRNQITPLGRATTDTSQLILTLASSMTTFAQIDKILNRLLTQPKMDYIRRIRWALSDGDLGKLLMRIQQHKATLNLLLTIWLSESAAQAETSNDILNDTLKCLLDPKQKSNLQSFDPTIYDPPICDPLHPNASQNIPNSIRSKGGNGDTLSIRTVGRALSVISGRSLGSKLRNSKVYAGARAFDSSAMSVSTSQRATPWSSFTIGSNTSVFSLPFSALDLDRKAISDVEEMRQVSLPLGGLKLYNDWWYPKSHITFDIPLGRTCSLREIFGLRAGEEKAPIDESPEPPSALKYTPDLTFLIRQLNQQLSSHIAMGEEPHSFLHQKLHQAINKTELSSIEVLLFLSAHNRFGPFIRDVLVSAFREVVAGGNEFIAKLFLDWGKWIEVPHQEPDHSILELALKSQYLEVAGLFLVHGVDTEKGYGSPAYTLLQGAVIGRFGPLSPNVAAFLLDRGASIEGSCKEEPRRPLQLAIEINNYEMIAMLLGRGANHDSAGYGLPPCIVLQSAEKGRYTLTPAQFLLERGVNIEGSCKEETRRPLQLAIESSNYERVTILLQHGANPDKACYLNLPCTPLQAAAIGLYDDSLRLAQFLLDKGVNIEGNCEEERRTPLQLSVQAKNYQMIAMLLERGANPNKACYGNPPCTPLQAAAIGLYDDSLRLAPFLLDNGVNIEGHCEEEHRAPLELAIQASNFGMVTMLLDRGANPERASYDKPSCTPLQGAAMGLFNESPRLAHTLLDWGVNIEGHCAEECRTPLQLAINVRNHEMIMLLRVRGATLDKVTCGKLSAAQLQEDVSALFYGSTGIDRFLFEDGVNTEGWPEKEIGKSLDLAMRCGDYISIMNLLKNGVIPGKGYGNPPLTPLQTAAMGRCADPLGLARLLLKCGFHVGESCEQESRAPLSLAIEANNHEVVTELLEWGANSKKYGKLLYKPLQVAALGRYLDSCNVAKLLLERGVAIEGVGQESRKPLEFTILNGNYLMIRILLDHGADLGKGYGIWHPCIPLQAAAIGRVRDSLKLAQFLLERGVNIEGCCYEESRTPLQLAIDYGNYEIISLLLKHGADPNKAYGNPKRTPLQVVAGVYLWEFLNVPKDLLDYGANIEEYTDQDLRTPLQIAVQAKNEKAARHLIDHRANIEVRSEGAPKTPIQIAVEVQSDEMVRILLDAGAEPYDFSPDHTCPTHMVQRAWWMAAMKRISEEPSSGPNLGPNPGSCH